MSDDAQTVIKTLLTTNWTNSNTDSITPSINLIYDVKEFGGLGQPKSYVLIGTNGGEQTRYVGMGSNDDEVIKPVMVDIRTEVSRSHALKCRNEVLRILKANDLHPDADNDLIKLVRNNELSDKRRNLWRWKLDFEVYDYKKSY